MTVTDTMLVIGALLTLAGFVVILPALAWLDVRKRRKEIPKR